ncbi:hypothetical protein RJ640_007284 [Escallonia rubra]|uniref:Cupin type-1 domain-containing protein n=1 Tax=Escallonia rubra TaxID=112253 RepID=A0AA88QZS3_9ASTE|nr:hypothetical protein RJ640_007284 [Escallonia rubra]
MASVLVQLVVPCICVTLASFCWTAHASDPDILFDYIVPQNTIISTLDGSFFTFTGMRGIFDSPTPPNVKGTQASMVEFPALNGQSVSMAVLQLAPGGINAPHSRPQATGCLFLVEGSLEVGFIDTTNKLYTQTLQAGDMFIFPKSLINYQYNANANKTAIAIAAFGSAKGGFVSIPATLFEDGIDDNILAKSLKTDVATIKQIKAGLASFCWMAKASDPDILFDFIVPANTNITELDGMFFTYTGMRGIFDSPTPPNYKGTQASLEEFPALNGQSVSIAVLQFSPCGINPPHTRPRSTGLLFVVEGCLEVGFVDTTNKLYTQSLQAGDMFVFPKGLIHYQYNANEKEPATAVAAFGSANSGSVSVPTTLFETGIDEEILAKAFKTDVATIEKIKAGLAPKS